MARIPERVLDLTHTLTPEFPLFPVYDPETVRDKFGVAEDGFHVRSWMWLAGEQHCNAPARIPGRWLVPR